MWQKIFNKNILILTAILILSGCTPAPRYKSGPVRSKPTVEKKSSNKNSKFDKKSKKKKSGKKNQKSEYNPKKKEYTGVSSYYGKAFHGKLTANGEVYDMYGLTAAHKTFPLNTICRVTNLANSKSLILRINDRGPYIDGRILDCSYGAAKKLDFLDDGLAEIKIEIIEWGDNEYMHHKK